MSDALAWLAARRSALVSGLASALSVLVPVLVAEQPVGTLTALAATGAGLTGYVLAFRAIGRLEKTLVGTASTSVGSIASGLVAGLSWQAITVTTLLLVLTEAGVAPALPSTVGSAAQPRHLRRT